MSSGFLYQNSFNGSIFNSRVSGYFLLLHVLCFIEIHAFHANRVDPDQMLHSAASDLGPHCLIITLYWVSGLKWVKATFFSSKQYFCIFSAEILSEYS